MNNKIFYLIIFFGFLMFILKQLNVVEKFIDGYGRSFGIFYPPKKCSNKENCYKSSYFRQ